jgi:hypothetical protein
LRAEVEDDDGLVFHFVMSQMFGAE